MSTAKETTQPSTAEPAGAETSTTQPTAGRLISLDVFRGLTMVMMTIVNNPGSWNHVYPPLRHAEWNGWTVTDLVFPFFIFIVGVAIPYSLSKYCNAQVKKAAYLRIFKRAAVLFVLGLILSGFPYFDLSSLRIMGVLQRLAICYLAGALIYLHLRPQHQVGIAVVCVIGYWLLMLIPPPDRETLLQTKDDNLGAWLDRTIFGTAHLWKAAKTWDPEGLLSTLPALFNTLTGTLTGSYLRSQAQPIEKAAGMFFAGSILLDK